MHMYIWRYLIVGTSNSPLDRQLDGHALTTHTYLGVEAIDPYITTQADGIHTIARRMDDEIKCKQLPPKSHYLIKPPKSPYLGIEDMTTGTLK